jgi:hypothetical protein
MEIIIILADVYWLLVGNSYAYGPCLAAGVVILIASLVWIFIDYNLMRK